MRLKIALSLGLAAALAATAALAIPPGPDEIGEFYVYFDANGEVVGGAQMDCEGNLSSWGTTSSRYSVGHLVCNPD